MVEERSRFAITLSTVIIGIIFLILPLGFFYLLGSQVSLAPGLGKDNAFGMAEILFSIIISLIAVSFLVWVRNYMENRPYLGLIIGILGLGIFEYGLFIRYSGPYTNTFAIIVAIIIFVYLGFFFFKFRKNAPQVKEEN
jgi:hypothetical protein